MTIDHKNLKDSKTITISDPLGNRAGAYVLVHEEAAYVEPSAPYTEEVRVQGERLYVKPLTKEEIDKRKGFFLFKPKPLIELETRRDSTEGVENPWAGGASAANAPKEPVFKEYDTGPVGIS